VTSRRSLVLLCSTSNKDSQLSRGSVRRYVIEQSETFSLLAELALALGGFTGVAAAFEGRDRAFTLAERTRFLAIFVAAASFSQAAFVCWWLPPPVQRPVSPTLPPVFLAPPFCFRTLG
jgi:hypothetical protein